MTQDIDQDTFIFFKDEKIIDGKGKLGVDRNRIVEIPNFVSQEVAKSMVEYFKKEDRWGETAFDGSHGAPTQMGYVKPSDFGLDDNIFDLVNDKLGKAVSVPWQTSQPPTFEHE